MKYLRIAKLLQDHSCVIRTDFGYAIYLLESKKIHYSTQPSLERLIELRRHSLREAFCELQNILRSEPKISKWPTIIALHKLACVDEA